MRAVAAAAAALAVVACSGSGSTTVSPAGVLQQAGAALAKLDTVSADVKFGPNVVFQGFTLQSATSRLSKTGDSDTTLKVKQNDFLVDLRVIATGGNVYLKVPFSKFQQLTPAQAAEMPALGTLLDARAGLPAVLPNARDPRDAGTEKVDGVDCRRIDATYSASQVGAALGGFKPAADIKASIWMGQSDHLVRRVILTGAIVDPNRPTTVQVDLHDFNAPVTVVAPTP